VQQLWNYVTSMRYLLIATAILILLAASCTRRKDSSASYYSSIEAWHKHRDAGLRSPDGWLTLAGLFWLQPGDNTIGSANTNEFVLPTGSAPSKIGRLRLESDKVTFTNLGGPGVTVNGRAITGPVTLSYDDEKPDVVRTGTLSFVVIKRIDRFGVRVRDSASPVLKHFQGMTFFLTNPEFHFEDARLIPAPKKIPILNIVGQTELQDSPGIVEFTYQGQKYHLRPIYEGKTLYFLFKDPTNRTETYQAGRMLNTPLPVNGKVNLDFNRSYNPPCTFTPYATCPLPPKENTLPIAIEAGEKRYRNGHPEVS
jgi:uncharacterized protein